MLEAATTTTTQPPSVAPTVSVRSAVVVDGGVQLPVMYFNHQDARSAAAFPNPRVRIAVTLNGAEQEIVAPLPALESGTLMVPVPDANPLETVFPVRVVGTEWDGGSLPGGAGLLTKP